MTDVSPHAPDVSTLVEAVVQAAARTPDRVALTFLADGEDDARHMTCAELDHRARVVAGALRRAGIAPGERALLVHPPGLDFAPALLGCLYAGVLAVPCPPPDRARTARTMAWLRALAEDADVAAVLTHTSLLDVRADAGAIEALAGAFWAATDALPEAAAADGAPIAPDPDDLAYLQYTSGSTSAPKGVMVSHRNLVHQLMDFDRGYEHGPDSVTVSWLPHFHDLGLVYGICLPLLFGFRSVTMSPVAFVRRPIRWLRAVHRYRGTHSAAPNFGYEIAAAKTTPEERRGLDLSCWKVALNGAEPIRFETERRFLEAFGPCGFSPRAVSHAFGMSETTAKISSEHVDMDPEWIALDAAAYARHRVRPATPDSADVRHVASCGVTTGDTEVVIVDPDTRRRCAPDEIGEIWIRGTTVARGYFRNRAATAETFEARLADDGEGPFLRSGDLGFVRDGRVYVSGRLKDMLVIRGQNHYPQDIEWAVEACHEALRPAGTAAVSLDEGGEERLVVLAEVYAERAADPEEVFAAIRRAAAEQGLHAWVIELIPPRALPKTSSGKVQRRKARELFEAGLMGTLASWSDPRSARASARARRKTS